MSCENKTLNIKSGSTLRLNCIYKNSDGDPQSVIGYSIYANFIDPGTNEILKECSTETGEITFITDDGSPGGPERVGEYSIYAGSTEGWPCGDMPVDILYSSIGGDQHTEDFILNIDKGRTQK